MNKYKGVTRDHIQYHGNNGLIIVSATLSSVALLQQLVKIIALLFHSATVTNWQLIIPCLLFTLLTSMVLVYYIFKNFNHHPANFTLLFLLSSFSCLIALRLNWYTGYTLSFYCLLACLLVKLVNYIITAKNDLNERELVTDKNIRHSGHYEWQLLFIRMFIGFDLVPHFCEKLFAGPVPRLEDIQSFVSLGVPHAAFFVYLAGIIEFFGSLSIGMGFLTRTGALALGVYLMVATYLGHHFDLGFIWASQGGGWEYPVLWTTLIVSFSFFGGGGFSVDRVLRDRFSLPTWLLRLMGSRYL